MNDSIKRISLDIHKASSGEAVNAKRGDTGRTIHISLVDGGVPYIISEDCYAVFTAKKADGKVIYNDCTIENNTIIYEVTEQTVAVEGRVNCEIKLYGADNKLITSAKFTILVYGTVYNEGDEVESSDEFNALTQMVGYALEAKETANEAAEKANEAATKAAHTAKALMVVGKTEGPVIGLDDAIDQYLVGCRIFGKTTQDGVPTPDAPVDLVSSVDGESLSIHVCGKNLFTGWEEGGVATGDGSDVADYTKRRTGYLPIFNPGQRISVSGIPDTLYNLVAFYDVNRQFISRSSAGHYAQRFFDAPENAKYFRFTVYESSATDGVIDEADAMAPVTMIEAGKAYTEYEAGKPILSVTVSTPNGIRGIPVSSDGNYIDANGQQWICDEIDFTRGVFIKRVGKILYDGSEPWFYGDTDKYFYRSIPDRKPASNILCDRLAHTELNNTGSPGWWADNSGNQYFAVTGIVTAGIAATIEEFQAFLSENPLTVLYILEAPAETSLTDEELAGYAALHTYREHTTVSNDGHAYMELEYVMDAKKYIDSLVKAPPAWLTNVTLLASAWEGADNLHSQVVTIAGVTPYSKVDLLPSAEQLAIFHNKDVAFVTENEGGVVTVYAIGDKPTNDYTMQAQITEVGV